MYWVRIHSNISNGLNSIQPHNDFVRFVSQPYETSPNRESPPLVMTYLLLLLGSRKYGFERGLNVIRISQNMFLYYCSILLFEQHEDFVQDVAPPSISGWCAWL